MKRRNFTLVELLVVIAIIGVLSAMILTAVTGATKKADETKCKAEMTTLVNAIKQYESTYGRMPIPKNISASATDTKLSQEQYTWMIKILQNIDPENDTCGTLAKYNKRGIKFLDIQGSDEGVYTDPWDATYWVIFDSDYDGKIKKGTGAYIDGMATETIHQSVVVWSYGNDGEVSTTLNNKKNRDNIYSITTNWNSSEGHIVAK